MRPDERDTLTYKDGIWRPDLEAHVRNLVRDEMLQQLAASVPVLECQPDVPVGGIAPAGAPPLTSTRVHRATTREIRNLCYSEMCAVRARLDELARARGVPVLPPKPGMVRALPKCVDQLAQHVRTCAHIACTGAAPEPLAPRTRNNTVAVLADALAVLESHAPLVTEPKPRLARTGAMRCYMLALRMLGVIDTMPVMHAKRPRDADNSDDCDGAENTRPAKRPAHLASVAGEA